MLLRELDLFSVENFELYLEEKHFRKAMIAPDVAKDIFCLRSCKDT